MRIQSSLAKGTFAQNRNVTGEEARMKAYNDGFMRLLQKSKEQSEPKRGKEGIR